MEKGWIKLHRKILNNPIIKRPAYYTIWSVLLLLAQHKEQKIMWNKDILIIKEGQLITGRDKLSEITSIPTSTIEDILTYLEKSQHQIQQQKTTKFRLITIINWKEYQNPTPKATTKQQQSNNKPTHTRMYKNDKNDKNVIFSNEQVVAEKDKINPIISLFKEVNPTYERLFANKSQRSAVERLITKFGEDKITNTIKELPKIINLPYAPKITTPIELERDIGKLVAFYNQQKNKSQAKKLTIIQ
jgi:hypothetical protein